MTLQEIIQTLFRDGDRWILWLSVCMALIEITPIKVNPWSAILKFIGKKTNQDLYNKVEEIEKKLDTHIKESEDERVATTRRDILDFGSRIMNGSDCSRETFDYMINMCDNYERHCQDHHLLNGVATATIEEIRRVYSEKIKNNDFAL